jgi:hypothetical protein
VIWIRYFFLLLGSTFISSQTSAADEDFTTQLMRATIKIAHEKSTATGFILTKSKEEKARYRFIEAQIYERLR